MQPFVTKKTHFLKIFILKPFFKGLFYLIFLIFLVFLYIIICYNTIRDQNDYVK